MGRPTKLTLQEFTQWVRIHPIFTTKEICLHFKVSSNTIKRLLKSELCTASLQPVYNSDSHTWKIPKCFPECSPKLGGVAQNYSPPKSSPTPFLSPPKKEEDYIIYTSSIYSNKKITPHPAQPRKNNTKKTTCIPIFKLLKRDNKPMENITEDYSPYDNRVTALQVFDYWIDALPPDYLKPKWMTKEMERNILTSLRQFEPDKIKTAIDGLMASEWHQSRGSLDLTVLVNKNANMAKFYHQAKNPTQTTQTREDKKTSVFEAAKTALYGINGGKR